MRRIASVATHLGGVMVVLSLAKLHAQSFGHYDFTGSVRFAWSVTYILLLSLAAYGVGLPELAAGWDAVRAAILATTMGSLAISALQLLVGSALLPRFVVLLAPLVLLPWYTACTALARGSVLTRGHGRVFAVVNEDEGMLLRTDLSGKTLRPATLVGTLDVEQAAAADGLGRSGLIAAATSQRISVVVLNRAALEDDSVVSQAAQLHAAGLRVRTLAHFYDEWLGKLPVGELGRTSLMFDIGELHSIRYTRIKRMIDAAVGLIGTVVFVAVVPAVAVGNLVANRGPLLHRQARVGKGGIPFEMYKFRTMRPGPAVGNWTEEGDVRITPFGRWMRRVHLDELPQMVNILRGHLATVGPRPEQPHYVEQLSLKIPFYEFRHLVRPGLTGWAQVNYRYGSSESDTLEKLRYDLYYLRHQGLSLDLWVLLRTLRSVMMGAGR